MVIQIQGLKAAAWSSLHQCAYVCINLNCIHSWFAHPPCRLMLRVTLARRAHSCAVKLALFEGQLLEWCWPMHLLHRKSSSYVVKQGTKGISHVCKGLSGQVQDQLICMDKAVFRTVDAIERPPWFCAKKGRGRTSQLIPTCAG